MHETGDKQMTVVLEQIIAECALAFSANSEDCNRFVKAVSAVFFDPDLFTGPNMNADAIVGQVRASPNWQNLGNSHAAAIAAAKKDKFVLAGMTSTELGGAHGHLAIVIGDDGQLSGSVLVPICYAGSLNPSARVQRERVSATFGATFARESKISYFARDPQTLPTTAALHRLVDRLRGLVSPVEVLAVGRKRARREKASKKSGGKKRKLEAA